MLMVVEEHPRMAWETCPNTGAPNTISYAVLRSQHVPDIMYGHASCTICRCNSKKMGIRKWLGTECHGYRAAIPAIPAKLGPMPVAGPIVFNNEQIHTSHKLWAFRGFIFCDLCAHFASKFTRQGILNRHCAARLGIPTPSLRRRDIARIHDAGHPYGRKRNGDEQVWPDCRRKPDSVRLLLLETADK